MDRKTSKDWYDKIKDKIKILSPEGWDPNNYDYSFNEEKITLNEFHKRLLNSITKYQGNNYFKIERIKINEQ